MTRSTKYTLKFSTDKKKNLINLLFDLYSKCRQETIDLMWDKKIPQRKWLSKQRICEVCWNNLELDGTCLTCRLAKRVEELQELLKISREAHDETMNSQAKRILELEVNIVELLFKIQELESALCKHKKILVERVEELEANVKGFGVPEV